MRITAKADYAVRAAAELAAAADDGVLVKGEQLARSQSIPQNFLENILTELRRAGIVRTRRGADGGYQLARPRPRSPLPTCCARSRARWRPCRETVPSRCSTPARPSTSPRFGSRYRASLRSVLEHVTLADLASGKLPAVVKERTRSKDSVGRAH